MPSIPAEQLRRLRNDIPVLTVIAALGMPVAKRGSRRTFRCPDCAQFHTATSERTNLARCFHCQRNFNSIDLVLAEAKVTFRQAVDYLQALLSSH